MDQLRRVVSVPMCRVSGLRDSRRMPNLPLMDIILNDP
jgi:hypothetical protein